MQINALLAFGPQILKSKIKGEYDEGPLISLVKEGGGGDSKVQVDVHFGHFKVCTSRHEDYYVLKQVYALIL